MSISVSARDMQCLPRCGAPEWTCILDKEPVVTSLGWDPAQAIRRPCGGGPVPPGPPPFSVCRPPWREVWYLVVIRAAAEFVDPLHLLSVVLATLARCAESDEDRAERDLGCLGQVACHQTQADSGLPSPPPSFGKNIACKCAGWLGPARRVRYSDTARKSSRPAEPPTNHWS